MYIERKVTGFITNLGKYNEGELVGEWVEFPIDEEEQEALLKRIGIGTCDEFGAPYEEYFFTDYENYGIDLYKLFGEYPSIESLNEIGQVVDELDDSEYMLLCALIEDGNIRTKEDIVNFVPYKYGFYEGKTKVEVAQDEIDELYPNIPDEIKWCIDYEKYADNWMMDYAETSFGVYVEY